MANTRSVKNPGVFASAALTTIPGSPSQGVSYRDAVAGVNNIADGWPYGVRVDSKDYNEILYRLTSLTDLIDRCGVLGWHNATNYNTGAGAVVFGSDGRIYKSVQASGPGTGAGAQDPISSPAYWASFDSVYNPPQASASTTVAGLTRYATDLETQAGTINNAAVTPTSLASLTANTTRRGLARLATSAEVIAGADGTLAVSPASLATLTALTTRRGLVRLATSGEASNDTIADAVLTPATLAARLSSTTLAGIIRTATQAEVNTGSSANAAVTPATLNARYANSSVSGIVRLSTPAEAANNGVDYVALTPAALAQRVANYSQSGMVRFATQGEVNAGANDTIAVNAFTLAQRLLSKADTTGSYPGLNVGALGGLVLSQFWHDGNTSLSWNGSQLSAVFKNGLRICAGRVFRAANSAVTVTYVQAFPNVALAGILGDDQASNSYVPRAVSQTLGGFTIAPSIYTGNQLPNTNTTWFAIGF